MSDRIFHLKVVNNTENSKSVTVWASEYAMTLAFEEMRKKSEDHLEALIASCLESSNAMPRGQLGLFSNKKRTLA